jgi:hypothetical protein
MPSAGSHSTGVNVPTPRYACRTPATRRAVLRLRVPPYGPPFHAHVNASTTLDFCGNPLRCLACGEPSVSRLKFFRGSTTPLGTPYVNLASLVFTNGAPFQLPAILLSTPLILRRRVGHSHQFSSSGAARAAGHVDFVSSLTSREAHEASL